jgi:hypothetical protein
MVDARLDEAGRNLLAKGSRWRTKMFASDDGSPKDPKPPRAATFKLNDDVNDFLKPSTSKAQEAAAALASATRPRIDVARAQRWPAAQTILNNAAATGKSPGPGGLRKGARSRGLSVNFARSEPAVIGHGGDECEEPSLEVSRRKRAHTDGSPPAPRPVQDDENIGVRTAAFNGMARSESQTSQTAPKRDSFTRTMTSHGELSPPLQKKLDMGHINTHASPPPPPAQRMGPMGLGERPRPLSRAPTGFDTMSPPADSTAAPRRPSDASAYSSYSNDSENAHTSPVLARMAPVLPPTHEDDESFRPNALRRTQTGFRDDDNNNLHNSPPAPPPTSALPRLPELGMVAQEVTQEENSPLGTQALVADRFLQSEPAEPDSFSARVKQRMRAEEGRALQEAAQRAHDEGSDASSLHSNPFQVGTPPSTSNNAQFVRTPPQLSSYNSYNMQSVKTPPEANPPVQSQLQSPLRVLEAEDPYRSRARGPSPARRAMPPGAYPLDTNTPAAPATSNHQSAGSQKSIASAELHLDATPSVPSSAQTPPQPILARAQDSRANATPSSAVPAALLPRQEGSFKNTGSLARSDTKVLGESAYKDFAERITHMRGIFQLTAQLGGAMYDRTPTQWLRVATWWFLKGRTGMEAFIRSRPRNAEPQQELLTQPHVDLAKAWWICAEVLPNHPLLSRYAGQGADARIDMARQAGDAVAVEVFETQNSIHHYMKMLTGSMKKHQSMPPTQALIQGQDQSIWEEYPKFAPDAASVISGVKYKPIQPPTLAQYIPLTDTKSEFCYFRFFGKASMSTDDLNTDRIPMAVVVSIMRPKEDYQIKLSICSQNESMNIIVGMNPDAGPTWKDVSWRKQSRQLCLQLRYGFVLSIELNEGDWRSLWAIVDHTNRVESSLRERSDERFSCKLYLREVSYKDPANPGAFPPERVHGCKLTIFHRFERSSEGTGKRKLHRGYRMVVVTPQQHKQISFVNHELGTKQEPMHFEYVTENDQSPAIRLYFREGQSEQKPRLCTLHLVFQDANDRNHLFGTFTSMNIVQGEMTFAQVPLKRYVIESADQAEGFSQSGSRVLERLQWQEAKVVNQDPEAAGLESAPTVMSESLRIVCRHTAGIISDRLNLGKAATTCTRFVRRANTSQDLARFLSVFQQMALPN